MYLLGSTARPLRQTSKWTCGPVERPVEPSVEHSVAGGGPRRRAWAAVPVVALLLPAAILFVFLQAAPLVAPFVYTVL